MSNPVEILLVEDNPADIKLTKMALQLTKRVNHMQVVQDGEAAMDYLHQQGQYTVAVRPDLIILDLNLPKKSGHEVLYEIKTDDDLRSIPVIILTCSDDQQDIQDTYHHYANCYITKPVNYEGLMEIVKRIEEFWFAIVKLPKAKVASQEV